MRARASASSSEPESEPEGEGDGELRGLWTRELWLAGAESGGEWARAPVGHLGRRDGALDFLCWAGVVHRVVVVVER